MKITALLLSVFTTATLAGIPAETGPTNGIIVGMEYILLDNDRVVSEQARMLAPIGAPAAKHYAEHLEWGQMQKSAGAPIDFRRADSFVREFQNAGFTDLVICLRSHSPWASRAYSKLRSANPTPKPEFAQAYRDWISAVVERYDGDGHDDMAGLKHPVRFYEIGSEFSSYEPEPVADYLGMLGDAHAAAHRAWDKVQVAHAALLATGVFKDKPSAGQYPAAFAAAPKRFMEHGLDDIRRILDKPEFFDLVNFHALGDPSEIEDTMRWLDYEMRQRNYAKPTIISDTSSSPFIAWGPSTVINLRPEQMGLVIPPATEADRPRLAAYFKKLVDGDPATVEWTQGFTGTDLVKKVVIAAEQRVVLIDTAFTQDLVWLKLKVFQGGTGTSAWSGLVDVPKKERRAGFFAFQQLMTQMRGYRSMRRVATTRADVRLYELSVEGEKRWIAWHDPGRVILPGDAIPSATVEIRVDTPVIEMETLITRFGQSEPTREVIQTVGGIAKLELTPTPILLRPKK